MSIDNKNSKTQESCLIDVKRRFFAQYWGQNYNLDNGTIKWEVNHRAFPLDETATLLLKPLSKITDEDALEVANIISRTIHDSISKELVSYYKEDVLNNPEIFPYASYSTVDYMRSKGYAVSFMEYSVEDLVSFGWVRCD